MKKRKDIKWHGVRDKQGWNVQICIRWEDSAYARKRKTMQVCSYCIFFFGYSGYEGAVT